MHKQQRITFFIFRMHYQLTETISNTNGNYAHKAIIETEFSSRKTWLVCQGFYNENGTDGRADDVAARKSLFANSQENYFIGKPASDI